MLATTTTTAITTTTTFSILTTPTTTITSDPGILCFHHCNVKVFCFTLPNACPHCKSELNTDWNSCCDATRLNAENNSSEGSISTNKLLPFRLPYPFVRAAQCPCAIVLRPTTGDFLNDYHNATDLHIAVTTSFGDIVEFDSQGLQRQRSENQLAWRQCLSVGNVPEPWHEHWDQMLLKISNQSGRWDVSKYDEETHNCYTFVLSFLQALAYDQLSKAAQSKTQFCEKYIVPRTTTAGKYISLYRKLRDTSIFVCPRSGHARS